MEQQLPKPYNFLEHEKMCDNCYVWFPKKSILRKGGMCKPCNLRVAQTLKQEEAWRYGYAEYPRMVVQSGTGWCSQ